MNDTPESPFPLTRLDNPGQLLALQIDGLRKPGGGSRLYQTEVAP
ncbi:hypothetical protein PPUN110474_12540 [Pseudomonas putida]|nr:hypothetical protein PPUN110474_12540 [Pseudomonas putida]